MALILIQKFWTFMGGYDTHFPCVSIDAERIQVRGAIASRKSLESR